MASYFYQCPLCPVKTFSYNKFLQHCQIYHESAPDFTVTCGFDGCPRQYTKVRSLKTHLYRKHKIESLQNQQYEDELQDTNEMDSEEVYDSDEFLDGASNFNVKFDELTSSFRRHLALFSLKLQEKHVVARTVQITVVDDIKDLFKYFHGQYNELLKICCREGNIAIDDNPKVMSLIDGYDLLDKCFDEVASEYQFDKYCRKELGLVEPVEYILGHDEKGKKETFQYIPILEVLKCILTKNDYWHQEVVGKSQESSDEILTDFNDGTICKKHPFFSTSENHLRIQLYNDEFEVVNPLGSKKLLHKVSGFYYVLGNILPKYRSQLKNIHIAVLVKNKLLQKYGYGPILKPLINDLQILKLDGIDITSTEGEQYHIKGSLAVISADNLSAHSLAGFSCSFSNGRICRYCMCHYHDMSEQIEEELCVLRTSAIHSYHLTCVLENPNNKTIYGVNGPCPFTELPDFDVTESFPPDVMHDFFEGAVPHVLKLIIRKFHGDKIVTLQELNKELQSFSYGQNDRPSKPVLISLRVLHDGNIAGKAIEKWTLLRVLPFLIGKYVPEDDECWTLYLLLRQIGDLILSPVVKKSWISYLEGLITQFLSDFKKLFPDKFTPKIHFLVHYPRLISAYGPPRSYWCLRFEAKHLYFKKLASVVNNFKNICYSLAKRYQMRQCWELQSSRCVDDEIILYSVSELAFHKLPNELRNFFSGSLLVSCPDDKENIWKTKEIVVDTVKYAVGDFFILELLHAEEIPQFVKVLHIIKFRAHWWICGRLYTTELFSDHLHAYKVEDSRQWMVFRPGDEVDFHALDCYSDEDDNLYVTLRHRPLRHV